MRVGIVGGTGQLGSAIARAWIETRTVLPENLWIANTTGSLGPLARWGEIRTTTNPADLCGVCDVIVVSVPPSEGRSLRLPSGNRLVISVMAGVTLDELRRAIGSPRIVRAMTSPVASLRLAFSLWVSLMPLSDEDEATVTRLLGACGLVERVGSEVLIDRFSALTGPVPGFVAAFAEAMILHATRRGVPEALADRAIRQLFLGAGTVMSLEDKTPAAHVQEMIDCAGTPAAGLSELRRGPLAQAVDAALEAAYQRTRTI